MNPTHALGWTLLHFVWEGALIAALLAGALVFLRSSSSRVRYGANCAAMLLMLVCAVATFLELTRTGTPESSAPAPLRLTLSIDARVVGASPAVDLTDYLPMLVWAWCTGVLVLSVRSIGGWSVARRFARRDTRSAGEFWEARFKTLARRLRISAPVALAVSTRAQVPAVVGWVRPIVLVPASMFTGLTAEQVEALLAHELAHVGRHDYLVNLLQTAVETLFFYHPAVWWVSRQVRNERENCCDDLAVEICGDKLAYVRALAGLEEIRHGAPRFALAADGGSLLDRVQRLLSLNRTAGRAPVGWFASLGIVAAVLVVGVTVKALAQQSATPAPATPPAKVEETKGSWLDGIQAEGYRTLVVDQLISMKIHGVTGEYIRQMRAAGFAQLTTDELVTFRIHGVSPEFINEMKQLGLSNLKADDLVSLRIHGAEPAWIREIQALGFKDLSADTIVSMRIHGITPAFIREVRNRGLKDITLDQLIQLKIHGIFETAEVI